MKQVKQYYKKIMVTMYDFSDENFEKLKGRYFNFLVRQFNNTIEESRDKEYANTILSGLMLLSEQLTKDEFSTELIETFNYQYKLGVKLTDILKSIPKIREKHIALENQRNEEFLNQEIKIDFHKVLYILKTPFIKQKTILDQKGNIIEQINYNYDFSLNNLKRLKNAKTKQEKVDILFNRIQKQEIAITNTIPLKISSNLIDINVSEDRKYFKFFVHYLTHKEFTEFLIQRIDEKKEKVESPIIDQIKNNPVLLNEDISTKEFSTAFQVLAMHYIFEELQVSYDKKSRNISAKTRLIKMLTGKNEDKIKSIIDSPLDYKDLKGQKEDLKKLTKYFEDLKLDSIVEKINKDFVSASSKKDKDL